MAVMLFLFQSAFSEDIKALSTPLRNAVLDLMKTFGHGYPRGRDFLDRIDQILRESAKVKPDNAHASGV